MNQEDLTKIQEFWKAKGTLATLISQARSDIEPLVQELGCALDDAKTSAERDEELTRQCGCPECTCATGDDAGSKECRCDAPVCSLPLGTTLAEAYVGVLAQRDRLRDLLAEVCPFLENHNHNTAQITAAIDETQSPPAG